jgi:hypothetical protein
MLKIKLSGKEIELYDNIEDLPMRRFHKYNKYLLVDSGVGSGIADFDRHIEKAVRFISKKPEQAITELNNLRQSVYLALNEVSPRMLSFAALVKSIDGKECDDLSDDGLKAVADELKEVTVAEFSSKMEEAKKKIDEQLSLYFPKVFDDSAQKEYYDRMRNRTIMLLRAIIEGDQSEETMQKIAKATDELVTYFSPQPYYGTDSAEIKYDKQYENMCLLISQQLHTDPNEFTVLQFYNAYEYVSEEIKRKNKAYKGKKK